MPLWSFAAFAVVFLSAIACSKTFAASFDREAHGTGLRRAWQRCGETANSTHPQTPVVPLR